MSEAFVYCWTDKVTNKLYVGSHKGLTNDGYICSSKYMMEEYKNRPNDFSRQIIAEGIYVDMRKFEYMILKSANAALDEQFYNKHNGGDKFNTTKESHKKTIQTKMTNGYKPSEETKRKIKEGNLGKKHSEKSKIKMSLIKTGDKHPYWNKNGPTKNKVWFHDPVYKNTGLFEIGMQPLNWIRGRK